MICPKCKQSFTPDYRNDDMLAECPNCGNMVLTSQREEPMHREMIPQHGDEWEVTTPGMSIKTEVVNKVLQAHKTLQEAMHYHSYVKIRTEMDEGGTEYDLYECITCGHIKKLY